MEEGLLEGLSHDVIASAIGICARSVDRHAARIHERWKSEARADVESLRTESLARVRASGREAKRRGTFAAALAAAVFIAKVCGFDGPTAASVVVPKAEPSKGEAMEGLFGRDQFDMLCLRATELDADRPAEAREGCAELLRVLDARQTALRT